MPIDAYHAPFGDARDDFGSEGGLLTKETKETKETMMT
jgi:hypothetical protein